MAKYPSLLSPTKIKPEQHEALKQLADRQQCSIGTLVRQAITEYLIKHGVEA